MLIEGDHGVLVQSGLWAQLSAPARSIAPVLAYFADKASGQSIAPVTISYRAISRYSGVNSPNAVAKGIRELAEIGWLVRDTTEANPGQTCPGREPLCSLRHNPTNLLELAQSHVKQMKMISKSNARSGSSNETDRLRTLRKLGPTSSATAVTEYKSLYSGNSAEQNGAIPCIAGVWRGRSSHQNGHEFAARSSLSTTPSRCAEAKPRLAKIAAGLRASNNRRGPRLVQDRKSLRARAARTNHSTFAADKDSRHAAAAC